ncbi:MAG: phosphatase PAP2 family protein [archaeon]
MMNAITGLDQTINGQMALLQGPLLSKIMLIITNIGSTPCLLALSIAAIAYLAFRKRWPSALVLVIGMIGGLVLELSTKAIVHRIRPGNALLEVSNYSFPSGHATMAFVFFGLMIYLFKDDIKAKLWRNIFMTACAALTLLVGFSRIYFNVHWLSDVVGGFIIGAVWLAFIIPVIAKSITKENPAKSSHQSSKNL